MNNPSLFEMLIYVYDIDVDNCRINHYDWAQEVCRATENPGKYYKEIQSLYIELIKERQDIFTRGNY